MASGNFDFAADGALQGRIVWSSTSKGSQANSSDVTATLYARRTDSYTTTGRSWSGYVKVGNSQVNINFSSSVSVGNSWVQMATTTTNIAHNADGSGTAAISGSVTGPSGTALAGKTSSGSQTVTLDKIARYTTITSFSVDKRNETSFTFKWQTADTIDYAWYSTDNGTTWADYNVADGTSGSFVVSKLSSNTDTNLSANTKYNCKLKVRRKDSQLNTNSGTVAQTTYDYPYCTDSPNFTIGNSVTLKFYNPLSRTIQVEFIGADNSVCDTVNISTTSISGYNGNPTITNLYNSIPNANSGKYRVRVTYGSSIKTRNNGNTYSVGTNTSNPTFSNFDYADTNATTTALTGNPLILVKGYSNNKITIGTDKKATAKNGATMKTYKAVQGTKTSGDLTYSSSAAVTTTLNAIDNNVITVSATDSRGNSTSVTKTLNSTYYKSYSPVSIKSVTATRSDNGVGKIVTLKINGTFWNSSFGTTSNDIISARYQYKLSSASSYSSYKNLTLTKSGTNFTYNGTIEGDLGAEGFSIEDSFTIRVSIKDRLVEKTYTVTLGSGTPAISIYKNKVAIGKKYDTSEGGAFQVNGVASKFMQHHGNAPTDLNDARTYGTYRLTGIAYNNAPTTNLYGILIVYESRGRTWEPSESSGGSSWIWQEIRLTTGEIYIRNAVNTSSSWSNWTDYNIYYKSGDIINFSAAYSFNGFISSAGQYIYITIVPPKKLDNVTNVTINALTLNIRGITGYVGGSGTDFTQYTTTATIGLRKDAIFITIYNPSGWGVTNNTPVDVSPSSSTGLSLTVT